MGDDINPTRIDQVIEVIPAAVEASLFLACINSISRA